MIPIRAFTSADDLLAHNEAIRKRRQLPPRPVYIARPATALAAQTQPDRRSPLRVICDAAAARHGVTTAAILSRNKRFIVVLARQEAIYNFYKQSTSTQARIGMIFGGVDASTITSSIQRHECRLALGLLDLPKSRGNAGLAFRKVRMKRLEELIFPLYEGGKAIDAIADDLHIRSREVRCVLDRAGYPIVHKIRRHKKADQ